MHPILGVEELYFLTFLLTRPTLALSNNSDRLTILLTNNIVIPAYFVERN